MTVPPPDPPLPASAVDGAICCTPQATYTFFTQSDVGKYFVPYNAFVEASTYYASKKTWEELDDAQREAVQAAVDRAATSFTDWARANDEGYVAKIKEAGWEVLDLTDAERAALADHIKANVWPAIEEIVGKEIIDRLRDDK